MCEHDPEKVSVLEGWKRVASQTYRLQEFHNGDNERELFDYAEEGDGCFNIESLIEFNLNSLLRDCLHRPCGPVAVDLWLQA